MPRTNDEQAAPAREWAALTRYLEHGALEIDNNGAERALKPIVLGRKTGGSVAARRPRTAAAILCSLVNTCKARQIDPFTHVRVSAHRDHAFRHRDH